MRHFHISTHKRKVIQDIHEYGVASVLSGFRGTKEDAIAAVQADPRTYFVACDCPKSDEGVCLGVEE